MVDGKLYGLLALLALAGCTPVQDGETETDPVEVVSSATPSGESAPEVFASTAWRAVAEDGSRYTTYFDGDGTYRDLRNGDPWQEGRWTYAREAGGAQLCFLPDDENGVRRCWRPGKMAGDRLEVTSDNGKRVELKRAAYEPSAEAADEEE